MLRNFKLDVHRLERSLANHRCIPLRRVVNACVHNSLGGGANVSVPELIDELQVMVGFDDRVPMIVKLREIHRLSEDLGVSVALPSVTDWKDDRFNASSAIDELLTNLQQARDQRMADAIALDWTQRGRARRLARDSARESSPDGSDDLDIVAQDWLSQAKNQRIMRNLRRLQLERHAAVDASSSGTESEPEPELGL